MLDGKYKLSGEGKEFTSYEFNDFLAGLATKFPIVSIEDGLDESDWDGWKVLTNKIRRLRCNWSVMICS